MKKINTAVAVKTNMTNREKHNLSMHNLGRMFTCAVLALMLLVPVVYCISAKTLPSWKALASCIPFILGYMAIGLVEAFSYAPLLGTGGQYMSFITGNISNMKLPCAVNSQNIAKVKQGSEEQEIVTTVSIAVCAMTATVIIAIGLIPLFLLQDKIVSILNPISPYVIPAIFGGLALVLAARYIKIAAIPFIACIAICVAGNFLGLGATLNQSTMVIIGMAVSAVSTFILYKRKKI